MRRHVVRFIRQNEGTDLIEYALLAGMLSLACLATLQTTGNSLNSMFSNLSNKLTTVLP